MTAKSLLTLSWQLECNHSLYPSHRLILMPHSLSWHSVRLSEIGKVSGWWRAEWQTAGVLHLKGALWEVVPVWVPPLMAVSLATFEHSLLIWEVEILWLAIETHQLLGEWSLLCPLLSFYWLHHHLQASTEEHFLDGAYYTLRCTTGPVIFLQADDNRLCCLICWSKCCGPSVHLGRRLMLNHVGP